MNTIQFVFFCWSIKKITICKTITNSKFKLEKWMNGKQRRARKLYVHFIHSKIIIYSNHLKNQSGSDASDIIFDKTCARLMFKWKSVRECLLIFRCRLPSTQEWNTKYSYLFEIIYLNYFY